MRISINVFKCNTKTFVLSLTIFIMLLFNNYFIKIIISNVEEINSHIYIVEVKKLFIKLD